MKQRATAIGVVAFLGMVDALYLTVMRGIHVPCSVTGGCNEVLTSPYSEVFGIPSVGDRPGLLLQRFLPGGSGRF